MKLNIRNFRDVSGYQNKYCQTMKRNLIFRGASLDRLTTEEVEYMEDELKIRYILDYRDKSEAAMNPDVTFTKAECVRISALPISEQGFDFGSLLQGKMTWKRIFQLREYLRNGYRQMPFDNPAYHKVFSCLLEGKGAIYFHCSAGKDRTGISAMLIMMALGMSKKDMIDEYLLSNVLLKEYNDQFYQMHAVPKYMRWLTDPLLYVEKRSILLSLKEIEKKYKTYEEFLDKEYGIDEEKRRQLRRMYCE